FDLHGDAGVAAEHIDNFHAGYVPPSLSVDEFGIADRFEASILADTVVLPVMIESLSWFPIKIDGPKIDEIEAALDGPLLQCFQLLCRHFGQGRQEVFEHDVNNFRDFRFLSVKRLRLK